MGSTPHNVHLLQRMLLISILAFQHHRAHGEAKSLDLQLA